MRNRFIAGLLVLVAFVPASAADIDSALQRLLDLEQSIPRGGLDGQALWETAYREKTTATMKPLKRELKAHGIRVEGVPADWLTRRDKDHVWSSSSAWAADFTALPAAKRCERVRLAYAFGIWQLTGLTAEQPVKELNDLLIRDYTDMDALWRDRARAAWAFRHIHGLPIAEVPSECAAVAAEAATRWNFIFDSDKRPTGLARYMCGRPMNSHWDDDAIDEKKKPEPRGWSYPVD